MKNDVVVKTFVQENVLKNDGSSARASPRVRLMLADVWMTNDVSIVADFFSLKNPHFSSFWLDFKSFIKQLYL